MTMRRPAWTVLSVGIACPVHSSEWEQRLKDRPQPCPWDALLWVQATSWGVWGLGQYLGVSGMTMPLTSIAAATPWTGRTQSPPDRAVRGGLAQGLGPAYAQPLSPERQVPASMALVTDSNRPLPLWQPPPTACLTVLGPPPPPGPPACGPAALLMTATASFHGIPNRQ